MSHSSSYLVLVLLVLFSLYRRVGRTVGMQRLVPRSMWTRIVMYAVICAIFLAGGVTHPVAAVADAAGAAAGAAVAVMALRTTVLERRGDQWYYRTHTWIGLGITAVFILRLAYRFTLLQNTYPAPGGPAAPHLQFGNYAADPLTTGVYFLLAAYYAVYYVLLMRKARAET